MKAVEAASLCIDERSFEHQLRLRACDGEGELSLLIGLFEALAIDRKLKDKASSRPLTHELLLESIRTLGGRVDAALIDGLEGDTYHGKLRLVSDGEARLVDARPSDAVTLALMAGATVYVEDALLEAAARAFS